ncbi:MAG: hypothetical protein AAFP79_14900 [Pseudomonadota bacterium]
MRIWGGKSGAHRARPHRRTDMTPMSEKLVSLVLAFGLSVASFNAYII